MSGQDITSAELMRKYGPEIAKSETFRTHGVSNRNALDYLKTSEGDVFLQRLAEADPNISQTRLRERAVEQIMSGRELPRMEFNKEPLAKIVPTGNLVSPHSPFFTKLSDIEEALAAGHNLSDRFGLPINSEGLRYDVYRIDPKAPTEVFVNQVAPTSELGGQVTKAGGARQYLVPNRALYSLEVLEKTVDNRLEVPMVSRDLSPRMLRTAGVIGAAASVIDLGLTARDAKVLTDQGNTVGAQSQVMRFGARNVGGWTGALVGAQAGAALGVESGPGMVLTGIAGAGIGAWGANKAVDWIEQQRINQQTDRNGMSWSFDPKQPDKGWTREVMDAFVERGPSIKHTETAPAAVADELNYKASSMAVQLRLTTPDVPVDPYRIAADASDTRSLRESPWTRNPQTQQWTREVADGLIDRTMHTYTETADPKKAVELDTYAQSVIAYNAARTPAAIAGHYEDTYAQADWKRYGSVPEAVTRARASTDALQASDGKLYIRGKDGEWTHDGVLSNTRAEGNVRSELDATQQQVQGMLSPQPGAITGPRMRGPGSKATDEKPSLDLERRAPGDTLSANSTYDQGMPVIPNPVQTRGPRDPRDPEHPDHAMNQSVREQVKALYAEHGISLSDQQLEQTTASVMKDARHSQMGKVTLLQFSENYTTGRPDLDGNLIAWQGDPSQPWSKMSSTSIQQAAQTQPDAAYQQFAQDTQQQAQVQARFLEQQRQLNDPTQQGPTMQR